MARKQLGTIVLHGVDDVTNLPLDLRRKKQLGTIVLHGVHDVANLPLDLHRKKQLGTIVLNGSCLAFAVARKQLGTIVLHGVDFCGSRGCGLPTETIGDHCSTWCRLLWFARVWFANGNNWGQLFYIMSTATSNMQNSNLA